MLTLDEQRVRLFVLVHIRIWVCCCLLTMIAISHWCAIYIRVYACNHTPMATVHDSGLISVEYTTRCYVDFGRTACTFICFGAHSNLDVLLLGYDVRNCTPMCHIYICNQTSMTTAHNSGLIFISVKYMTHCHVGFAWTNSSCVYLFCAHSNLDVVLLA